MNVDLEDIFSSLAKQPVYLTITIFSSVFIVFSIIYGRHVDLGILTLLFSTTGFFWRFFIVDLRKLFSIETTAGWNVAITLIFHLGNLVLIFSWAYLLAINHLISF